MRTNLTLSGRYRLDEPIGRGGMGEVWRATDLRLGRAVAVKLLSAELDGSEQARRRFEREATAAAALRHRGIAVVFDTGFDEQSRLMFFVMELLDGENLQRLLERTPEGLPAERVREFGAQIASALAEAHERGVVHRDIKPANVILMPGEELKICDFGIARLATQSGSLTQGVLGTPSYMAPEQLRGGDVDGRTDLYSLGCLLYALATGRPPFVADGLPALMYQHINAAPQPVTALRPDFPGDLSAHITQCLAKNPAERPPSARSLADALRRTGTPETWASRPWAPAVPAPAMAAAVSQQAPPAAFTSGPPQTPPPAMAPGIPPQAPWGPPGPGATRPAGGSRSRTRIAVAAAVAVTAVAATAVTLVLTQGDGDDTKGAAPSSTSVPSAPPSQPVTPQSPVSVPEGWILNGPETYQGADCTTSGPAYRLDVAPEPGWVDFCSITDTRIGDIALNTTVTLTGTQCASLVVRRQEPFSYEFVLCANGGTFTRKWSTDDTSVVIGEKEGIAPIDGTAQLTAVAQADTFSLYLNGSLLTAPKDTEIAAGGIALGTSVLEPSKKSTMTFTNLTLWTPPTTPGS